MVQPNYQFQKRQKDLAKKKKKEEKLQRKLLKNAPSTEDKPVEGEGEGEGGAETPAQPRDV